MIMIIISYVPEMYRLQPTELCLVCLLRARVVASVCQRRELKKKICSVAPTKKKKFPKLTCQSSAHLACFGLSCSQCIHDILCFRCASYSDGHPPLACAYTTHTQLQHLRFLE
jgi:hypothetical protein